MHSPTHGAHQTQSDISLCYTAIYAIVLWGVSFTKGSHIFGSGQKVAVKSLQS